ncbi:unnamed protein product [Protopolystoma xenopodis]|uniref:Uncharacterized protein n=1 Tax=Protopolystoma xenopodis TaxID=117903 RepID=A0A448XBV1_9PLAT|nr:unnamed protein product [Protopolystoma xenopodis]
MVPHSSRSSDRTRSPYNWSRPSWMIHDRVGRTVWAISLSNIVGDETYLKRTAGSEETILSKSDVLRRHFNPTCLDKFGFEECHGSSFLFKRKVGWKDS